MGNNKVCALSVGRWVMLYSLHMWILIQHTSSSIICMRCCRGNFPLHAENCRQQGRWQADRLPRHQEVVWEGYTGEREGTA